MSQWKSNYLNSNTIKLHYHRTGGDKTPIILSHGVTDSGLCWIPVARRLERIYDVIMVDARGHGLSDSSPTDYTIDDMTKDLIGLIKVLELDRPILMGHSMGAQISARAAALHPDLVSKLILEDPGYGLTYYLPNFIMKRFIKVLFKRIFLNPLKGRTQEELLIKCKKDNPKWSEDEIEPWVSSKIQLLQNNPEKMLDSLIKSFSADWYEMIKDIQCHVLLLISNKGLTKNKVAKRLTEEVWKSSQYVEIQNAGHNIRRENFEDFMQAVNSFLKIKI